MKFYEVYDNRKNLILEGSFKNMKEIREALKDDGYRKKSVIVIDVAANTSQTMKL